MSEPDTAWYVMRNAVKFQDYSMVQQVMSRYVGGLVMVDGIDRDNPCAARINRIFADSICWIYTCSMQPAANCPS